MRIVAIANGGFAIPTLRALKDSRHEVVAAIVMPLRTKRSGSKAGIPPVRAAVEEYLPETPVYSPENINSPEGVELIKSFNADLFFICDYGRILAKEVIESTRLGGINLHGSLLPKYRGAAPINRAIQAGERELGVSVIFIEPKFDAGPVVATTSYVPSLEDTAVEIEATLAQMGARLVVESLDRIESGSVEPLVQDASGVSKAPKIKKEEGHIDWSSSSESIIDLYRAFQPWPRVYSDWISADSHKSTSTRLILGPFSSFDQDGAAPVWVPEQYEDVPCGSVLLVTKTNFWIKTGNGALRALAIQPAGKKPMSPEVFLRGYPIKVGDKLC